MEELLHQGIRQNSAKPTWLKIEQTKNQDWNLLHGELKKRGLHTVCEEARCPNIKECWSARTATIMILGDVCTRGCRFCHVKTGNPQGLVELREIKNSSELVGLMSLRYVVITSVDRDDLEDHGAQHFANVINRIHADHPEVHVEALVPDFGAVEWRMDILASSQPYVVAQNMETVKRLTYPVRDVRASYEKTLRCLEYYKSKHNLRTKSSLMVGLGETLEELQETMRDLRSVGTDIITFGQYLQPTAKHLPVVRYYTPEEFRLLKKLAYEVGFSFVASGPLVRSSYKASDYLEYVEKKQDVQSH